HGLTLFEQLIHRKRMVRRRDAELAVRIYHNGNAAGHWYTRDAAHKAGSDEIGIADTDSKAFVAGSVTSGCADVDVIAAVDEVLSRLVADHRVQAKIVTPSVNQPRVTDGNVCLAVHITRHRQSAEGLVERTHAVTL